MTLKEIKKKEKKVNLYKSNFFQKNKSKPLYILLSPISYTIYILLGLWIFKKISWFRRNLAPIWKIINIAVLSSPATVFISFILPIIFIFILGNISHGSTAVAGTVSMVPVLILVISMPIIFVDFKRSSLLKRLFISNVKKGDIILAFVTYFILLSFISISISIVVGLLAFWNVNKEMFFEYKKMSDLIKHVSWGTFFLGITLNLFFAGAIGIIISSYAQTPMFALAIGMLILIPGGFLSGQFFSLGFVLRNKYMNWVSFIFWQKYTTSFILASFDVTNKGIGLESNYVPHEIFSSSDWQVVKGFKDVDNISEKLVELIKRDNPTLKLDDLLKFVRSSNPNNIKISDFLKKIIGENTQIGITDFVKKEYLSALTPTLTWISFGVSVLVPIPLYSIGISKFRWSTR